MPVQRLDVFLLDVGAKHGQLLRCKILRLEVAVPVRLVGPGIALGEVGLVDGAVQLVGDVELSRYLQHGLVETVLAQMTVLHIELDGRAPSLATEIGYTPDFTIFLTLTLIEASRRCLFVAHLEFLALHTYAVCCLREHPQDDIEAAACGIIDFLYWYHIVLILVTGRKDSSEQPDYKIHLPQVSFLLCRFHFQPLVG